MIQKITQNNGNFWTVNLIMRAKIVNQSSDFPVRRTGSYRHKKSTGCEVLFMLLILSKVSVNEVFMHHFDKRLPLDPAGGLLFVEPFHCPHLKNILRAPMISNWLNVTGSSFLANWRSRSLYVIVRPSVCLSVGLSVCNVRAPYLGDWNLPQCFFTMWYAGHLLTSM